ncbi:hypothetical protein CI109_105001 [Kwoniella shandongensis]|uniref:Uncharacterized protein n=1 Tax=Kwoniella shandongensis TaxID=1734106 RepID=A0A5M6BY85_9TREE|nr:uncharacterized protein CI109_004402 [Kwoniella shandongensis]KAA5527341.1 hypothetical protein CI109_004402 [Kwoniella shandongensis]
MAQIAGPLSPSPLRESPIPSTYRASSGLSSRSRSSISASVSPPPTTTSAHRTTSTFNRTSPISSTTRRWSSESKENEQPQPVNKGKMNGNALHGKAGFEDNVATTERGNGGGRAWRDGSIDSESESSGVRVRKNPPRSARPSGANGLSTLPTIPDPDADIALLEKSVSPPPPAPSTQTGTGDRPIVTRKRRSSSVKRKPSPGAVPTKAVDWEIPRKTFHSSIGFVVLFLKWLDPPSLKPLITVLSTGLVTVSVLDYFRLNFPGFAEVWEAYFGFLMRESERQKINGVIWYLIGVIFVLGLYPRDVAVVSILTLSWSDTTASTIGRLWGRYTKPLPSHVPGIKFLPFAPRKSLAGFLAAMFTTALICITFWWNGSGGRWTVLDVEDYGHGYWGLWVTSIVVGLGGAVVEALDLGLDDNLTLPILSGAIAWFWLSITNLVL